MNQLFGLQHRRTDPFCARSGTGQRGPRLYAPPARLLHDDRDSRHRHAPRRPRRPHRTSGIIPSKQTTITRWTDISSAHLFLFCPYQIYAILLIINKICGFFLLLCYYFATTLPLLCPYFPPTLPLPKTNDITMKRNDKAGITLEFSREFEA